MDRLEAMTAFVTVADLRGFAPAARKLAVSPSAVTRSVAALEDHLGIRLFQRTTRTVVLTDAGARYLERARRIVLDVGEADDAARAERTEPRGRFVISAPLVFGRMKVAPVFCDFLRVNQAVHGELVLVNLVDEGVDLAVRIGHLADGNVVTRKVGETRRVLVASPGYLERAKRIRRPDDLAAHDLIQCTALTQTPEWRLGSDGEARVAFTPRFVTNSVDVAIGHAELGGGVTMALAYQVESYVARGSLAIVLPKFEPPSQPIQLVYATRRHLSANVRAFVDHVTTKCAWRFVEL
jgi:DNA-binding transcriptional LysR family regulator